MLEDAVDDAADTKRRFDNVRSVLLFLGCACLFCEADHFSCQGVLLLVGGDRDCLSVCDLLCEILLSLLISGLEELNHVLLVFLKCLANDLLIERLFGLGDCDFLRKAS